MPTMIVNGTATRGHQSVQQILHTETIASTISNQIMAHIPYEATLLPPLENLDDKGDPTQHTISQDSPTEAKRTGPLPEH